MGTAVVLSTEPRVNLLAAQLAHQQPEAVIGPANVTSSSSSPTSSAKSFPPLPTPPLTPPASSGRQQTAQAKSTPTRYSQLAAATHHAAPPAGQINADPHVDVDLRSPASGSETGAASQPSSGLKPSTISPSSPTPIRLDAGASSEGLVPPHRKPPVGRRSHRWTSPQVENSSRRPCWMVHIPEERARKSSPFETHICGMCAEGSVPAFILSTTECPEGLPITGRGSVVEARVCRLLRKGTGETHATETSQCLPFLELELHRQLVYKLRLAACNAAFGLQVEITLGPNAVIGIASASALCLACLPSPEFLYIKLPTRDPYIEALVSQSAAGMSNEQAKPEPRVSLMAKWRPMSKWKNWWVRRKARRRSNCGEGGWAGTNVMSRRRLVSGGTREDAANTYRMLEKRSWKNAMRRQRQTTTLADSFDCPSHVLYQLAMQSLPSTTGTSFGSCVRRSPFGIQSIALPSSSHHTHESLAHLNSSPPPSPRVRAWVPSPQHSPLMLWTDPTVRAEMLSSPFASEASASGGGGTSTTSGDDEEGAQGGAPAVGAEARPESVGDRRAAVGRVCSHDELADIMPPAGLTILPQSMSAAPSGTQQWGRQDIEGGDGGNVAAAAAEIIKGGGDNRLGGMSMTAGLADGAASCENIMPASGDGTEGGRSSWGPQRRNYIFEVDDELDEMLIELLAAEPSLGSVGLSTVDCLPGALFAATNVSGGQTAKRAFAVKPPQKQEEEGGLTTGGTEESLRCGDDREGGGDTVVNRYYIVEYDVESQRCHLTSVVHRELLFELYRMRKELSPSLQGTKAVVASDVLQSGSATSGADSDSEYSPDLQPLPAPFVYAIRRIELSEATRTSASAITNRLSQLCSEMYAGLIFRQFLRGVFPCCLSSIHWRVALLKDDTVELVLTAHALRMHTAQTRHHQTNQTAGKDGQAMTTSWDVIEDIGRPDEEEDEDDRCLVPPLRCLGQLWDEHRQSREDRGLTSPRQTAARESTDNRGDGGDDLQFAVLVSPLSSLPYCKVLRYLGLVSLHVIKETTALKQFEAFYHEFMMDTLTIARAHVKAMGGNALLGFRINNILLKEDKNQAYAVLSICGDAASIAPCN
eukprot:GHVS01104381.1.p1 GENE.GHVS01104381.1~~GHVS01104381.1.p1  ORF type:complete len:1099 (-),score=237.64 GHVS01104381.1:313-3609(-)